MQILNKILFVVLIFVSVFFASRFEADPDLWGHTKYGLDTLAKGELLRTDIYSYSAYGQEWINHEWLSELLFGVFYKNFGVYGLLFLKTFLSLLLLFLIYSLIACQTKYIFERFVLYFIVLISLIPQFLNLRPQIFSFIFSAVYMSFFYKLSVKNNITIKDLFLFPLIMLFWANLHGGFPVGIGLLFLFIVADIIDKKKVSYLLLIFFVLTIVATLINPYGFRLYKCLYLSITSNSCISEWNFLNEDNIIQWLYVGFVFLVLIISQLKKKTLHVLFLFVTAFMGIRQMKLFPFFILSSAVIIPPFFSDLLRNKFQILKEKSYDFSKIKSIIIVSCFLLLICFLSTGILSNLLNPISKINERFPIGAVKYIKEQNFKGKLLSHYDWAQYCIWELYPDWKMFYDGRFRTVYDSEIEKEYFNFHFVEPRWDNLFEKYTPDLIIWKINVPVIELLKQRSDYVSVYKDAKSIVFKKVK